MKLRNNQSAVDFSITDIYGNSIQLSDFKGKKIHLGFFRNVNCPFCNLRVHQLSKLKEDFEKKNLKVIYFFESHPKLLLRSSFHQEVSPISLIGDPEKKVYTKYGVETSPLKMLRTIFSKGMMGDLKAASSLNLPSDRDKSATQTLVPADFLIDEEFNIRKAYYGRHLNDHIAIDEIKRFAGI